MFTFKDPVPLNSSGDPVPFNSSGPTYYGEIGIESNKKRLKPSSQKKRKAVDDDDEYIIPKKKSTQSKKKRVIYSDDDDDSDHKPNNKNKTTKQPSAYNLFVKEHFHKIKEQFPNLPFAKISELVGQKWKTADKKPYEADALVLSSTKQGESVASKAAANKMAKEEAKVAEKQRKEREREEAKKVKQLKAAADKEAKKQAKEEQKRQKEEEKRAKKLKDAADKEEEKRRKAEEKLRLQEEKRKKQEAKMAEKKPKTKPGVCGAPTLRPNTLILDWKPPSQTCGGIQMYSVRMMKTVGPEPGKPGPKELMDQTDDNQPTMKIAGTVEGAEYLFWVKAKSTDGGWGNWSAASSPITIPVTAKPTAQVSQTCPKPPQPTKPQICSDSVTPSSLKLKWEVKSNKSGKSSISQWMVKTKRITGDCEQDAQWEEVKDMSTLAALPNNCGGTLVVENLQANSQYQFKVKGKNVNGWSVFSKPSQIVHTGSTSSSLSLPKPSNLLSNLVGSVTSFLSPEDAQSQSPPMLQQAVNDTEFRIFDLDEDEHEDEYYDVLKEFKASLNGHLADYTSKRFSKYLKKIQTAPHDTDVQNLKYPINFKLLKVQKVENKVLQSKFEEMKLALKKRGRCKAELKEHYTFHGTSPPIVKKICRNGLLRIGHPLNPSPPTDDGWFGMCTHGVYVSRHPDYCLKYSNDMEPLQPDEKVKVLMFKTLPGKYKHISKSTPKLEPTQGFDSHRSSGRQEYFLFNEAQALPAYVLTVKGFVDTRIQGDDQ